MKPLPGSMDGLVVVAATLSAAGLITHNVVEFSARVLLGPETLVPLAVTAALLGLGLQRPRRSVLLLLSAWAGLHLLLGVASALPLSVLPFEPEQTLSHYTAHVAYAAAQAPLLWLGIRRRGRRRVGSRRCAARGRHERGHGRSRTGSEIMVS